MQNFVAAPQREDWSRAQISIILLDEKKKKKKKKKKKSSFPLIKAQMKRKLVIFWVLKLISHV